MTPAEFRLLRLIAHESMGIVDNKGNIAAGNTEIGKLLAASLNEWIETYEKPRLDARAKLRGTDNDGFIKPFDDWSPEEP